MPVQPVRGSEAAAVDPKPELQAAVTRIVRELMPQSADVAAIVERPREAAHGDYATNVALVLAKAARRNPRELATQIGAALGNALPHLIDAPEVAGPGFINIRLKPAARQRVVASLQAATERYLRSQTPARQSERHS